MQEERSLFDLVQRAEEQVALAAGGAITRPEGVYWLEAEEADVLAVSLEAHEPLTCHAASVEARKASWQRGRGDMGGLDLGGALR
jgi:hypothetical protein